MSKEQPNCVNFYEFSISIFHSISAFWDSAESKMNAVLDSAESKPSALPDSAESKLSALPDSAESLTTFCTT